MKIYIINAFPERREYVKQQLLENGRASESDLVWIEAPLADNIRETKWKNLLPCRDWVDPYTNNFMKWGQVACFSSHMEAWTRIFEGDEDSAIVVEDDINVKRSLQGSTFRGDLTYLGGKQIGEEHTQEGVFRKAGYLYWTCGYHITKETATRLLRAVQYQNVIPTDELLPYHGGENPNVNRVTHNQATPLGLDLWRKADWVVEPSGKWKSGTEESSSCFSLQTFLYATEADKCLDSVRAYSSMGYQPQILGLGRQGWDSRTQGGIRKLHWLREVLNLREVDPLSIWLLLDGYDTLPAAPKDNLLHRFSESRARIVIGGERGMWPKDAKLQKVYDEYHKGSRYPKAPFRYPNSGFLIGFQKDLKDLVTFPEGDREFDQAYYQAALQEYQRKYGRTQVDSQAYLVLNLNRAKVSRYMGAPFCAETNCCPAIVHANGPTTLKDVRGFRWKVPKLAKGAFEWMEVADGILAMPFLDDESCLYICSNAEMMGDLWKPLPGDKVPGDELRIRELDAALEQWFVTQMNTNLSKIVTARWRPATWHPPSDLFLIRYSTEGQPSLHLHEDISYMSGSIKLRDSCCGGELYFPRQNYSDKMIPRGWLVLWPSRITHPHQVLPVEKGKRISMVVWTQT